MSEYEGYLNHVNGTIVEGLILQYLLCTNKNITQIENNKIQLDTEKEIFLPINQMIKEIWSIKAMIAVLEILVEIGDEAIIRYSTYDC